MDIYKALGEERPEWHDKAACRGMTRSFWNASIEDQKSVCKGTIAPWAKPCPVAEECLQDFVAVTIRRSSLIDASFNTTVYGGYSPEQLLVITRQVRREMKEENANPGSTESTSTSEDSSGYENCG